MLETHLLRGVAELLRALAEVARQRLRGHRVLLSLARLLASLCHCVLYLDPECEHRAVEAVRGDLVADRVDLTREDLPRPGRAPRLPQQLRIRDEIAPGRAYPRRPH